MDVWHVEHKHALSRDLKIAFISDAEWGALSLLQVALLVYPALSLIQDTFLAHAHKDACSPCPLCSAPLEAPDIWRQLC